jgi:hypothetical protein
MSKVQIVIEMVGEKVLDVFFHQAIHFSSSVWLNERITFGFRRCRCY